VSIYGIVKAADTQLPIGDAVITVFGSKQNANQSGCFKSHVASALPFTLTVTATGYKTVAIPIKYGFGNVIISMSPVSSGKDSAVDWQIVDEQDYARAPNCM
jgi:hypothetical protein